MDEIWLISEGTSRLKAFCTPFINHKITHFYCYSSSKGKLYSREPQSNNEESSSFVKTEIQN